MAYPEPSINDCSAPWNEIETENGVICGCSSCERRRREEARQERLIDDYEDRRMGW